MQTVHTRNARASRTARTVVTLQLQVGYPTYVTSPGPMLAMGCVVPTFRLHTASSCDTRGSRTEYCTHTLPHAANHQCSKPMNVHHQCTHQYAVLQLGQEHT